MRLQSLVLHEFELPKALPWTIYSSPSFLDCFGDQKAIKTPKLNTIWLETIARVLNMLIGLKGNNYYSRVFKRVNYKLQNSTFWVVINKDVTNRTGAVYVENDTELSWLIELSAMCDENQIRQLHMTNHSYAPYYAWKEIELPWLIRLGVIFDENQTGQRRDRGIGAVYAKNDNELLWSN